MTGFGDQALIQRHLKGQKLVFWITPGATPTTMNFNASVVKIYCANTSMAHFYKRNYFSLM
jgi:hypothetical protein